MDRGEDQVEKRYKNVRQPARNSIPPLVRFSRSWAQDSPTSSGTVRRRRQRGWVKAGNAITVRCGVKPSPIIHTRGVYLFAGRIVNLLLFDLGDLRWEEHEVVGGRDEMRMVFDRRMYARAKCWTKALFFLNGSCRYPF